MNFWQPSGGRRFAAIPQGAPFLFKTHYSHGNRIVGAGFLSGWASLPMSRAWEFFGPDNGCADLAQMRARIGRYRGGLDDGRSDQEIGCIMLRDVRFFDPEHAPCSPARLVGEHRAGPQLRPGLRRGQLSSRGSRHPSSDSRRGR